MQKEAKTTTMERKEAAAMIWIYIWDQQPWHFGGGRLQGLGVNGSGGSMQEQEETKSESAGELKVLKDMRGYADR